MSELDDTLAADERFTELPEWVQNDLRDIPPTADNGTAPWHEVQFEISGMCVQCAVINRRWCPLTPDQLTHIRRIICVFRHDHSKIEVRHNFCDNCPGCRPAMMNQETGEVLADDSPEMKQILDIWYNQTTYQERKAFINVTLHNSRDAQDLRLAEMFINRI